MVQHMPARSAAVVSAGPVVSSDKPGSVAFATDKSTPVSNKHLQAYRKALAYIRQAEFSKAIDLLNYAGQSPDVLNAKGVCQMRQGLASGAVATYRAYVLDPGSAMIRASLPAEHVVNFATALLLTGHPAGCLEVLGSVRDNNLASVNRLKDAITRWSNTLGLWQRFNWRVGRVEPNPCVVPVDFVPGDLDLDAIEV